MKMRINKRTCYALATPLVIWSLMNPAEGFAQNNPSTEVRPSSQQMIQEQITKEKAEAEKQAKTVQEAFSAVDETRQAVRLLDDRKIDAASNALKRAIGKLDIALAQNPNLALIPVTAEVQVQDLVIDEPTAKTAARQIKDLVDDGKLQDARKALIPFASEINITTTNFPMATYPLAIRAAARLINEGKSDLAKAELQAALNSLVIATRSLPLPVIKAQALVDEVGRQVARNNVNKSVANRLLDEAQEHVKVAETMGYEIPRKGVADFRSAIKQLKNDINRDKENSSLVSKITNGLRSFRGGKL